MTRLMPSAGSAFPGSSIVRFSSSSGSSRQPGRRGVVGQIQVGNGCLERRLVQLAIGETQCRGERSRRQDATAATGHDLPLTVPGW
jgi:hypothetical protein